MMITHVDRYLLLRQTLGFKLVQVTRLLRAFANFVDQRGETRISVTAAVAWSTWEGPLRIFLPQTLVVRGFEDTTYALAFARIETHYFVNRGWFEPEQLIRNAPRLRDIPTVIVQGRYDMCTPAVTAWELHRALPEAEFLMIPDAGHAFDEPGILNALIEATDRLAE